MQKPRKPHRPVPPARPKKIYTTIVSLGPGCIPVKSLENRIKSKLQARGCIHDPNIVWQDILLEADKNSLTAYVPVINPRYTICMVQYEEDLVLYENQLLQYTHKLKNYETKLEEWSPVHQHELYNIARKRLDTLANERQKEINKLEELAVGLEIRCSTRECLTMVEPAWNTTVYCEPCKEKHSATSLW